METTTQAIKGNKRNEEIDSSQKKIYKSPETKFKEMEINDILNRYFKLMVRKMLTEFKRATHK